MLNTALPYTSLVIAPEELWSCILRRKNLLILDVRSDEDFARSRLEAGDTMETLHIPYFDFIEEEEKSLGRVPVGRAVVVVCARGGASAYVAELLEKRKSSAASLEGGMDAWGHFHDVRRREIEIPGHEPVALYQIHRVAKGCLSYVLATAGEAVVIDPSRDLHVYQALAAREQTRITWIFDTHLHADHISGGPALAAASGVAYILQDGKSGPGVSFTDGATFRLGSREVQVISLKTPGHTPGSVSLLLDGHLFSGDTLFVASVGRPDLGGQVDAWSKDLYRTITERLSRLDDDTLVFPAHTAGVREVDEEGWVCGRLGHLRRSNPALQASDAEAFTAFMRSQMKPQPAIYDSIRAVNAGERSAPPDEAEVMELGRNECAASGGIGTGTQSLMASKIDET